MTMMESSEIRRVLVLLERGVSALERIATAIEQANAADPLQMIQDALQMEQNQLANLDGDLSAIKLGPHPVAVDDVPPHIARAIAKGRE